MKKFFTCVVIVLLASCNFTEEEQNKAKSIHEPMPSQTATNIDVTYSENALIKVKLSAPLAIMENKGGQSVNEFPDGLLMTFYDKEGIKTADLYADYGYDNQGKRERYAKKNVRIISADSTLYETDEIYIDEVKDSIHNNEGYVKITKPDGTLLQGYGFLSNTRMNPIRINNVFNSKVPVENQEITTP